MTGMNGRGTDLFNCHPCLLPTLLSSISRPGHFVLQILNLTWVFSPPSRKSQGIGRRCLLHAPAVTSFKLVPLCASRVPDQPPATGREMQKPIARGAYIARAPPEPAPSGATRSRTPIKHREGPRHASTEGRRNEKRSSHHPRWRSCPS